MDTISSINKLRSQFLQITSENDQSRRMMKPYIPDADSDLNDLDPKIKDLYTNLNGPNILNNLLSPPISNSFMENYTSTNARRPRNRSDLKKKDKPSEYFSSRIDEETDAKVEMDLDNTLNQSNAIISNSNDAEANATLKTNMVDNPISKYSVPLHNNSSSLIKTSKADIASLDDESTLKTSRKPTLRLARLFIGKKDGGDESSTTIHNTNQNNQSDSSVNTTKASKSKSTSQINTHMHKPSKFDMNFDYDENLDEEDEEDEDEEGASDNDAHAKFFQIKNSSYRLNDKETNLDYESNGSSGTALSDIASGHNNPILSTTNNLSKRITHFPQNVMTRGTTSSDVKSNSSKPDKSNSFKLNKKTDDHGSVDGNLPSSNNKTVIGSTMDPLKSTKDEDDTNISDIESYFNDNDLENIAMGNNEAQSLISRNSYKENSELDISHTNSHVRRSQNPVDDMFLSTSELVDDDHSSYGKSLLFSDFSGDEFADRKGGSTGMNSFSQSANFPSTTRSMSYDDYRLLKDLDDSAFSYTLDKTSLNLPAIRKHHTHDIRYSDSLKEYGPRSVSSRRSSVTSILMKQHSNINAGKSENKHTTRSHRKVLKELSNGDRKSRRSSNDLVGRLESSYSVLSKSTVRSRSNSIFKTDLDFEKDINFKIPAQKDSLLSRLLKKKKETKTDTFELLKYFSFTNGKGLAASESLLLTVYIQDSSTFKRKGFSLSVKKSASVFDVIGFILYSYSTDLKPKSFPEENLPLDLIQNPNNFSLQIVDEDGDPFEDNFGKLNRNKNISTISDNEVVLCKCSEVEKEANEYETPLPYTLEDKLSESLSNEPNISLTNTQSNENIINQRSYYTPIVGENSNVKGISKSNNLNIKVYLYPNLNPKFNFTVITVSVTSNINDILVKYCRMKNMDPTLYMLKIPSKNLILDLNDTVLRLDGNHEVEIISKREARQLRLEKIKPNMKKPVLPTIQSNDLTPLTLEQNNAYLGQDITEEKTKEKVVDVNKKPTKIKKHSKYKLGLSKGTIDSTLTPGSGSFTGGKSFFKSSNSSKSSLHGTLPYFHPNRSATNLDDYADGEDHYQDLVSGAYHKYRVWRRQQMSLIAKHERTLALDGDFIYIVPPDRHMHWHENVKTKSIHISQVASVKRSKRIPEYFKLYVERNQDDMKRYYFEAVSEEECKEIVSRIQNLLGAYRMNHKK